MSWTYCTHKECEKSNTCERFINKNGTEINFKSICPNNNYKWYWKTELNITKVDTTIKK